MDKLSGLRERRKGRENHAMGMHTQVKLLKRAGVLCAELRVLGFHQLSRKSVSGENKEIQCLGGLKYIIEGK